MASERYQATADGHTAQPVLRAASLGYSTVSSVAAKTVNVKTNRGGCLRIMENEQAETFSLFPKERHGSHCKFRYMIQVAKSDTYRQRQRIAVDSSEQQRMPRLSGSIEKPRANLDHHSDARRLWKRARYKDELVKATNCCRSTVLASLFDSRSSILLLSWLSFRSSISCGSPLSFHTMAALLSFGAQCQPGELLAIIVVNSVAGLFLGGLLYFELHTSSIRSISHLSILMKMH